MTKIQVFIMTAIVSLLLLLTLSNVVLAQEDPSCTIVKGDVTAEMCIFEEPPVCHKMSEFPRPSDLAEYYGGVPIRKVIDPDGVHAYIVILTTDDQGNPLSMSFMYPVDFDENSDVCLKITGRPIDNGQGV